MAGTDPWRALTHGDRRRTTAAVAGRQRCYARCVMRPTKLFHAIVVVGASLTACGGDDDVVADAGTDAGRDASAAIDAAMSDDAGEDDAGEDAFVAIL